MNLYAQRIRSRRETTVDPTTGSPYTQARIAELLKRSRTYMGTLEGGGIETPPPEVVNRMAEILPYSVFDQLRDMGYALAEPMPLNETEKELLEILRKLPKAQRGALLATARALLGTHPVEE